MGVSAMSVRAVVAIAVVSFLAMAYCYQMTSAPTAEGLPNNSHLTHAQSATASYEELKEHVARTIDFVDESTDRWYRTSAAHLRSPRVGQDLRWRVSGVIRHEEEMAARWKIKLRKMADGECPYAQAAIERRKIDAEAEAMIAEQRAMTKEMQQIPGCHCGN
jgi:hypothetical protein